MHMATKLAIALGALIVCAVILGGKLIGSRSTPVVPAAIESPSPPPVAVVAPPPPPPPARPIMDAAFSPALVKKPVAAKPKLLTEAALMERLRKAQDTDEYLLSYDLAREGLRRFPDSPDAPEMAAMVVKSLARQGKASEARAEAEVMVNKYAGTKWALEVERHTGAHPIRNQVPPQGPPANRD